MLKRCSPKHRPHVHGHRAHVQLMEQGGEFFHVQIKLIQSLFCSY